MNAICQCQVELVWQCPDTGQSGGWEILYPGTSLLMTIICACLHTKIYVCRVNSIYAGTGVGLPTCYKPISKHYIFWSLTAWYTGPWFNIKMLSYQYRKSHCGDKTVVRSSYLHNGISYTGKITSLYWIGALAPYLMWIYSVIFPLYGKQINKQSIHFAYINAGMTHLF